MQQYLMPDYYDKFNIFSETHLYTLLFLLLFNILLILLLKHNENKSLHKGFRYIISSLMIIMEAGLYLWFIITSNWDWSVSLPLHLSRIATILAIIIIFTENETLYQFGYFIILVANIPALIIPELPYNFPHFLFFKFFITHFGAITIILYMTFCKNYRPQLKYLAKTILVLTLMLPPIGVVNYLTGGNYLFLSEPPEGFVTLLTQLNFSIEWPWYILFMYLAGIIFLLILYLPFQLSKIKK